MIFFVRDVLRVEIRTGIYHERTSKLITAHQWDMNFFVRDVLRVEIRTGIYHERTSELITAHQCSSSY